MSFPRSYKENRLSSDWYTKLVLTVLAICAVAVATRELRGDSRGIEEGRYRLQVLPMGRMMLKIDSQTGAVWKTEFPDPKAWTQIADERVDTLDDVPSPSPAEEPGEEGEGEGGLTAEETPATGTSAPPAP